MLEKVLNYEYSITSRQGGEDGEAHEGMVSGGWYVKWGLGESVGLLPSTHQPPHSSIMLVGTDEYAQVGGLFYCLMKGTHDHEDGYLELRHSLYENAPECLHPKEERQLVEGLGIIRYTHDIGEFLRKSPALQTIITKILMHMHPHQELDSLQSLKLYCPFFPFLRVQSYSELVLRIIIYQHTFYLVREQSFLFVIEPNARNNSPKFKNSPTFSDKTTPKFYNSSSSHHKHQQNIMNVYVNAFQPFPIKNSRLHPENNRNIGNIPQLKQVEKKAVRQKLINNRVGKRVNTSPHDENHHHMSLFKKYKRKGAISKKNTEPNEKVHRTTVPKLKPEPKSIPRFILEKHGKKSNQFATSTPQMHVMKTLECATKERPSSFVENERKNRCYRY